MALTIDKPILGITQVSVNEHDVQRINSLEILYPTYRQDSKAPTFALTYQGTWVTLVKNCGFTPEVAKQIVERYNALYSVSNEWVQAQLDTASQVGYVVGAFGLRVRTPKLKQVVRGSNKTPYAAVAEGRTAGNALGQSWCLLNTRAGSEFMGKVRASKFRFDIRPCAHIHDAQYYLIRENVDAVMFTNEHLVKAVNWNDHPAIYHPEVGLGGDLSIFFPTWANEITVPNGISEDGFLKLIEETTA